ncbi:hypothetical protein ASPBRDRAFT_267027 [Aspergillus brasiliensis CBS 101740]|uniref:Uncharacterized protein n=1 Tax=Aspergillus brasiliensis (strain CBS 101740 / IMI 381727 / IBT 21946) TaxID=767769 RepID=A0A1L9V309_ASPBC|nr:hypothetical protein ASPBRDRAFT_267027 [Aspergillus brasiliensis CBS 101740]
MPSISMRHQHRLGSVCRQLPKGIGSEDGIARPPPTLTHTQTTHDVISSVKLISRGTKNSRWPPGHRGETLADGAVGGPVAADGAPIRKRWGLRRSQGQTAASCLKGNSSEARGSRTRWMKGIGSGGDGSYQTKNRR